MKAYFTSLTGVRAVAAYMVFLHHAPPIYGDLLNKASLVSFWRELHVGVSLFFVLSGFLIAYRYWDRILLTRREFKSYLTNRFARIFPVYFFLTCCTFVFIFHNDGVNEESIRTFFLNITLLRGFSHHYLFSGIAQGWSLSVEETFYLTAPLLLYFGHKLKTSRFWLVLLGYVLIAFSLGLVFTKFSVANNFIFFEDYSLLFHHTFFGRAFEFAAGAGLAVFMLHSQSLLNTKGKYGYWTWFGIAGIFAAILGLVSLQQMHPFRLGIEHPLGLVINNYFLPLFVVFLYYGLLIESTIVSRVLSHPVLDLLGKSSYSFYLLHLGVLNTEYQMRFPIDNIYKYLVFFLFIQVVSVGCYLFIEEPANKFIRGWVKKREIKSVLEN